MVEVPGKREDRMDGLHKRAVNYYNKRIYQCF